MYDGSVPRDEQGKPIDEKTFFINSMNEKKEKMQEEKADVEKFSTMGVHTDRVNETIVFDTIMQILMTNDKRPGKNPPPPGGPERLPKEKIIYLVSRVGAVLQKEPTLLELEPPIVILGDTHGQFGDLLDIVDAIGWPPQCRFLFMGDYVDRGDQSVEVMCLLYLLKSKFPDDFFLLRGNHETAEINSDYGFKEDCLVHYDIQTWDAFQESFKRLPLAALVGSKILCMHGGLSPALQTLEEIRKIPRPVDIPDAGLACDLLWSDPTPEAQHQYCCGFCHNKNRNTSVWFCRDIAKEFLKRNDLDLIVRGHEVADNGYQFTTDKKLITIFSAPFYCENSNDAAALYVDEQLRCQIRVFIFKKPFTPKRPATEYPSSDHLPVVTPNAEPWNEMTLRKPIND